jgi:alkylation response protein AidB-like acyl-CoA dehydrogenase
MINLPLNEIQSDLVDTVGDMVGDLFPIESAIKGAASGIERIADERWGALAELGAFGIALSEDEGGVGLGSPEEYLVFREFGRGLVPGPLVGTALAARYALQAGDVELSAALVGGARRAGMVVGDKVVDADAGDLAVAVDVSGITIFEVESVEAVEATDPLSRVGIPRLRQVHRVDDDTASLRGRLLVGAYAVGLAEATADISVEYAKTREQFGRPIGAFQAVKHRCSEMVIRAYPARVQLAVGAVLLDEGAGRREIASGHVMAVEAAYVNAGENIQNFGGIGFTAEARPGSHLKRAITYRNLLGSVSEHIDELLTAEESLVG